MIRASAVLALLALAACQPGHEPAVQAGGDAVRGDRAALAVRDCGRAEGDSARAVCVALNQIEHISGYPAVLYAYQRRGDTVCVETLPNVANMVDGGGVVEIVRGRVATAFVVDSGGCRKF